MLAQEENLDPVKLEILIKDYLFMGKTPQRDDILDAVNGIVGLSQRKILAEKIMSKINDFVDIYDK